jgi:hypothetical protein
MGRHGPPGKRHPKRPRRATARFVSSRFDHAMAAAAASSPGALRPASRQWHPEHQCLWPADHHARTTGPGSDRLPGSAVGPLALHRRNQCETRAIGRVGARRLHRLAPVGFRAPLSEPGVHLLLCTGLSIDVDAKSEIATSRIQLPCSIKSQLLSELVATYMASPAAWMPYSSTASLRHVHGSPVLRLLRRLRPPRETSPDWAACRASRARRSREVPWFKRLTLDAVGGQLSTPGWADRTPFRDRASAHPWRMHAVGRNRPTALRQRSRWGGLCVRTEASIADFR